MVNRFFFYLESISRGTIGWPVPSQVTSSVYWLTEKLAGFPQCFSGHWRKGHYRNRSYWNYLAPWNNTPTPMSHPARIAVIPSTTKNLKDVDRNFCISIFNSPTWLVQETGWSWRMTVSFQKLKGVVTASNHSFLYKTWLPLLSSLMHTIVSGRKLWGWQMSFVFFSYSLVNTTRSDLLSGGEASNLPPLFCHSGISALWTNVINYFAGTLTISPVYNRSHCFVRFMALFSLDTVSTR